MGENSLFEILDQDTSLPGQNDEQAGLTALDIYGAGAAYSGQNAEQPNLVGLDLYAAAYNREAFGEAFQSSSQDSNWSRKSGPEALVESYKEAWQTDPFLTGLGTVAGLTAITAGARLAAYHLPPTALSHYNKFTGPFFAVTGALDLSTDAPRLFSATNPQNAMKYGIQSTGDLMQIGGGVAMWFPQTRTAGTVVNLLGMATKFAAATFMPEADK